MFEIKGNDIALLDEEDLRSLVALLCEAEVQRHGFSSSTVTWGGDQKAPDGGVDVRVTLPASAAVEGFLPRSATGFQVKKQKMPRTRILDEMRPHGILREVIRELANQSGAYIIVSSTESTSDLALRNRCSAMAEALQGFANASALTLDFYDRNRIATWVRRHPGLVPWVRERIGKAIPGWRSYGAWAYSPEGVNGEYLVDKTFRIQTPEKELEGGVQATEGINRIRRRLMEAGGVVRLVGLSGVGKTRLAQALFDARTGERSLDPSLALYTNLQDEPDPQPTGLASDLLVARESAILIVDNCPPDLHRRLSELCRSPETSVSLLTIEYDIREDLPEGTDVFELQPASSELIETLIKRRFSTLSQIDARTIADFSGGNARIAIALAETVEANETIAGLKDEELFQRLFHQRHQPDNSLLLAAQACSLAYSFNGEDLSDSSDAELVRLGAMVGQPAQEVFRSVAELRRRGLVQQRGVWRAVLPHAIANRLATMALQNIPYSMIRYFLVDTAPERLQKSFSRRLGYLHTSKEARSIVTRWLGQGGLLENVPALSDLRASMFENVAPVEPEAALAALERAFLGPNGLEAVEKCRRHFPLLRLLAYDPALFERCLGLIVMLAETEDGGRETGRAREAFGSLFTLLLSGTHAPIEQRLAIVESLLVSDNDVRRELGALGLKCALQAWHFSAFHSFEFGARSRDFGYWPRSPGEVNHWFGLALKLSEKVGCASLPAAPQVRAVVAEQFRGLWTKAKMYNELGSVCRAFAKKQFWPDGWIAVRTTLHFDRAGFSADVVASLVSLEESLRPVGFVQMVRSIVLSPSARAYLDVDLEEASSDDIQTRFARMEATAQGLGKAVAVDESAFAELLPELVTGEGRLWSFGRGLIEGAVDPTGIWKRLVAELSMTAEPQRRVQVLCGCLHSVRAQRPELAESLLEDALQDGVLAPVYPVLQSYAGLDGSGVERVIRSLALARAPIVAYRNLYQSTDTISGADFERLVSQIAGKAGGFDVAIELIEMRLHSEKTRSEGYTPEVLIVGRELLRQLNFVTAKDNTQDYRLGDIAKQCLVGKESATIVRETCRKLKDAVSEYRTHLSDHDQLLQGLFGVDPIAALDGLFAGYSAGPDGDIVSDFDFVRQNPFDTVPESHLLAWCDREPEIRYPVIAAAITPFRPVEGTEPRHWTPTALRLLGRSPDRIAVLRQFVRRFRPMMWSGSRAVLLELNARLLEAFESYSDPSVARFAAEERLRFRGLIDDERRYESAFDRASDERFE